jgi:hypothetical protein
VGRRVDSLDQLRLGRARTILWRLSSGDIR